MFCWVLRILFAQFTLITIWLPTASIAQQFNQPNCPIRNCDGDSQDWNKDHYQFQTFSHVVSRGGLFIYQTCVKNSGSKDLEIKWDIAGPDNWILKGCSDVSEREKNTRKDYGYYSPGSCLRYGNSWRYLRAKFHAHVDEKSDIDKDKERGESCEKSQASLLPSSVGELIQTIKKTIFFTAPYDEKDTSRTMTKVQIDIAVSALAEKKTVFQNISYHSEPAYFDNKDFKFGRFRAVPDPAIRKDFALVADDKRVNKDGTFFLDRQDSFVVSYGLPPNPALTSLPYVILTASGKRVGSVLIPTWVSVK